MARSDLLVRLAEAIDTGDKSLAEATFTSIIAEERAKNHHIVADRLSERLQNFSANTQSISIINDHMDKELGSILKDRTPNKVLSDLVLSNHILELCNEVIEEHSRSDLLRSYGLEPRNRILFTGPPGNGKTSLAEAIANELMIPFYVVNYDSLIGSYLGETSSRLKKVFDFVKPRNCVLFFDEFDTIAKERGSKYETGEIKRVVSTLLLNIDDLPSNVIVITASNHAELLDRAVWRRFQVKFVLKNPTRLQLENWFTALFNNFPLGDKYSEKTLAKYFYGKSFSDVEEFVLDVKRRFVLRNNKEGLRKVISYKLKQWNLPES